MGCPRKVGTAGSADSKAEWCDKAEQAVGFPKKNADNADLAGLRGFILSRLLNPCQSV